MRILLVSAHGADLTAGGTERYVADLAAGLSARGHDVRVLAAFPARGNDGGPTTTVLHRSHWRDDASRRFRNHAGDVLALPGRRLAELVSSAQPNLVHTSNLAGFSTSVWEIARRRGLPVVHTLHDYHLLCPRVTLTRRDGRPCCSHPRFCAIRTRRLARWAGQVSHVLCGSEHLWRRHEKLFPRARVRVVRVPLVPLAERPLRPPSSPPRAIGYLGSLERIKGVEPLLAAAPSLRELGLQLHVAGDGRLRPEVEAAQGIVYAGRVLGEDKLRFIESVDVGVAPSIWEEANGPPYAVAEWLSAGRPALVSARGGLAEAVSLPGVLGIEPTATGIAEGARRLLDAGQWERSLAARLPVGDHQDFERWLDDHEAVYAEAGAAS